MTEPKPPSNRPDEQTAQRPIPDGGLGEVMPDWLRRPPAWHDLESKAPPRRALPPPDDSVIDPATLITDDDLPDWLRSLAPRRRTSADTPPTPPATAERRVIPRIIESRPRATTPRVANAPNAPASSAATSVERETVSPLSATEPIPIDLTAHRQGPSNVAVVLGTLLAVALITIAILLWLLLA